MVNLGVGIQNDTFLEESAVGLAGANLGVGGFLTEDLALMFRLSGTNVAYDLGLPETFSQVSAVGGPAVQYWISDRFNLEAGVGLGIWNADDEEGDRGLGLILGAGVTIFNRGKHNLQVGVEYAPAFTKPGAIHNVGFTLGYQFF